MWVVWLVGMGCEPLTPCDDYVDYMCACHADEVDCDELTLTYVGADPDVQDECAVLLDEQQAADDRDGLDCAF
jgi:hypothetical protein